MQLHELTSLIRAKNAGPFMLTIDIMPRTQRTCDLLKTAGILSPSLFARLYQVPEGDVRVFYHDVALAIKASFPRLTPSGNAGDTDVFGGQFHAPLVTLEIDLDHAG